MSENIPIQVKDVRKRGFYITDNLIMDVFVPHITPYGYTVYGFLCRKANENEEAWTSLSTIAKRIAISVPTVVSAIGNLEKFYLLSVERDRIRSDGGWTSNLYTVLDAGRALSRCLDEKLISPSELSSTPYKPDLQAPLINVAYKPLINDVSTINTNTLDQDSKIPVAPDTPVKPEPKPRKSKTPTPKPPPTPDDRTQRTALFNAMYDAAAGVLKLNSQTTGAILSKAGKFQAFADEGITVEQATRAGQLLKAWRATPPLDQTVGAIVTLLDTVMNAAKQGITAGDIEAAVKNINSSKSPQFAGVLKSVLSEAERVRAEQNRKQPKTTDALIKLGAMINQQQHDRALYVQAMNSPDATGNEASWIKQCDDLIAGYVEKKRELEAELAANNG